MRVVCSGSVRAALWPGIDWPACGLVPAAFERADQGTFDLGGDVAVGLDDSITEMVAEASGLGDFGDAVGDEPGLVAVP
jgi:hypothetical protein